MRKLTPSRVALEIALDSQTVDQAFKEVYRELARGAKIPGFRKGKAPREVVERTFGQEDIRQRVWRKLAGRAFMDAVEEVGVIPIDLPNFDYTEPQENQPLTVQATVTIKPEPKLGEYKGIKLTRHVAKVEDNDVDEELEKLRERRATYAEPERNEVRKGDLVVADISIVPEGSEEPIVQEDVSLLIGQKQHEPPLDEALIGATIGSPVTIETEFGPEHPDRQLAGKKAQATLTVKSIKERKLPELDDEFAKDISDYQTIEEVKQYIRQALESVAQEVSERDLRNQAVRAVSEASEVDVPEQLVVEQAQHYMDAMMDQLRQRGLTLEQFLRATNRTTEELYAEHTATARASIKNEFVIDAIAQQEGIDVSDEELDAEIARIAQEQEVKGDELRRELQKQDQIEGLRARVRRAKAVDFILEHAQIEEVDLPRKDESRIIQPEQQPPAEPTVTGGAS